MISHLLRGNKTQDAFHFKFRVPLSNDRQVSCFISSVKYSWSCTPLSKVRASDCSANDVNVLGRGVSFMARPTVTISNLTLIPLHLPPQDGPGMTYARKVADLAVSDPPTFICHYYNFYFAHTAGGRMIGSKMSQMLLDSAQLNFYKYEGDMQEHLDNVRKVSFRCVAGCNSTASFSLSFFPTGNAKHRP